MIILVTGSRTWDDDAHIWRVLDELLDAERGIALHHGACPKGADAIADAWAVQRRREGRSVLLRRWPAKWRIDGVYDRGAGMRRNAEMVAVLKAGWNPGKCLAFIAPCAKPTCRRPKPHGSHGATQCAELADEAGIEVVRHLTPSLSRLESR